MESCNFIHRLFRRNKRNLAFLLLAVFVTAGSAVCFSLSIFVAMMLFGGPQMIREFIEGASRVATQDIIFWSIPVGAVGFVIGIYVWKALISKTDWISAEEIARLTRF